jgi:hypothetical protein
MRIATVRVSTETRDVVLALARANGLAVHEIIARAVELYRRQQLLAEVNAAYEALRSDPIAWLQVGVDRSEWDVTLQDGLEQVTGFGA